MTIAMTTTTTPNSKNTKGKLYLVPAPLDFGCDTLTPLTDVLPLATIQVASQLQHWVCENAKSTRAYLKRVDEICPLLQQLQAVNIQELPREVHKKGDHPGSVGASFDAKPLLAAALQGFDVGLVSEAGMPAIADPGSSVVRAAHDLGITVTPLIGPISLMLALAASGLNGQNFAFVGYLPSDATLLSKRIKELEQLVLKTGQTQLFIETPYRNASLLQILIQQLQPTTRLAISCGLTLANMQTQSEKISAWRQKSHSLSLRLPSVFSIG
jgi:16S rRNA (cytidine1402-2'-O)-methyltransferase